MDVFKAWFAAVDWQGAAWRMAIVLACVQLRITRAAGVVARQALTLSHAVADPVCEITARAMQAGLQHYLRINRWVICHWTVRGAVNRSLINTISGGSTALLFVCTVACISMPTWNETQQIWNLKNQYSITFLDRNGRLLGHRGGAMDTSYALSDYPPQLIRAVLATEDRRFYSHVGVDPLGITSALLHNWRRPEAREKGGSTITQQLVKNIWLTPERSLSRKIKEAWLALWIEQRMSKDDILRMYLERSYMGAGNYGVAAASQYYFNKPVTDLTIAESAMLAGVFKSPVNYSPSSNLQAAQQRAATVLGLMLSQGMIDQNTYDWAIAHPARTAKHDALPSEWALDQAYAETMALIQAQGLAGYRNFTVHTTVDADLQEQAEQLLQRNIAQQGQTYDATEAALVSMGVDGSLRALVGGVDYSENQFNRAIQARRQPGSSFKPFVYLTALLHGWTPTTRVLDAPISLQVFGHTWSPVNFDGRYRGDVTLQEALQHSLNTVAVRIMLQFGRQAIIDTARDAGIHSELRSVATLPLGSNEVSLLEITNSYTTFASGGQFQPVWSVSSIEHDGTVVYDHANQANLSMIFPKRAIEDMVGMMKAVVDGGTAVKARMAVPVAGKTGTTSDFNDAWFIGYTGNLVTGVWYGNDDNWPMEEMTGGKLPAETWREFMTVAESREQPRSLPGVDWHRPTEDEVKAQAAAKARADAAAKSAARRQKQDQQTAAAQEPVSAPAGCFWIFCAAKP
jgi:penicillin-binding protein 1A